MLEERLRRVPSPPPRAAGWESRCSGPSHRVAGQAPNVPLASAGTVAQTAAPRPSPRSTGPLPSCIFCDRPSGTIEYAWPEWLCRALTDQMAMAANVGVSDPDILARVRREVDQTVRSVCDTCSQGWMQRLEDNVSPFLQSMIVGEVTPLPPVRRRVLARWAAKTAVVMECALRRADSHAPFRV